MSTATELGLDAEHLHRRMKFLEDRAEAHTIREGTQRELALACAGRLWRDAATLAILLEDYDRAQGLFAKAGTQWADLGLFSGFGMMALATERPWWSERPDDLQIVARVLRIESRSQEHADGLDLETTDVEQGEALRRQPMIVASAGSARQLLHLYQSFASGTGMDDDAERTARLVRQRLDETPSAPMGPTGVPVGAYLQLLDAASHGDLSGLAQDTLAGMVMRRAEQLRAARRDEYHWRLALKPAELVDLDLLTVAIASLDAGHADEPLHTSQWDQDGGVEVPLRAARGLRSEPPSPRMNPQ